MTPFTYTRAVDVADAVTRGARRGAIFIAGGTDLVNLLKEGIVTPADVIDINRIAGDHITIDSDAVRIGAGARMSDVAAHPEIRRRFPAIARSLDKSASAQIRNMASMGGNLMQRTRCPYFRADKSLPCNKRTPHSGCAALEGITRGHAIWGGSASCIATHPSDVAVALAALGARVHVRSSHAERVIDLADFYRLPGDRPQDDTTLRHGEVITEIDVPRSAASERSSYLKVRERASYEFALVSAAVAADVRDGVVRDIRIALGGVAPKPWRLTRAEDALRGTAVDAARIASALDEAFAPSTPRPDNAFKIGLAKRTVVRALHEIGVPA